MAEAEADRQDGPAEGEAGPSEPTGQSSSPRGLRSASSSDASFRSSEASSATTELDDVEELYRRTQSEYEEIPDFRHIPSPLRWWKTRAGVTRQCSKSFSRINPPLRKRSDSNQSKTSGAGNRWPPAKVFRNLLMQAAGRAAGSVGEDGGKAGQYLDGHLAPTWKDLMASHWEPMGSGGTYGIMYRVTLNCDGSRVAVRRLPYWEVVARVYERADLPAATPLHADESRTKLSAIMVDLQIQLEAEVDVLRKIRHPNLMPLRAYYIRGEKLLVYDYMPMHSLADFLLSDSPPKKPINWPTMMKIAIGVSRGLHHLHAQESIVHGNLTPRNILMDHQNNPKIADFGISGFKNPIEGSRYRAPELSSLKKPNTKTDVFSLGVILHELLMGEPFGESTDGRDHLQRFCSNLEQWPPKFEELYSRVSSMSTVNLVVHCMNPSPDARPEVLHVLQQLEGTS